MKKPIEGIKISTIVDMYRNNHRGIYERFFHDKSELLIEEERSFKQVISIIANLYENIPPHLSLTSNFKDLESCINFFFHELILHNSPDFSDIEEYMSLIKEKTHKEIKLHRLDSMLGKEKQYIFGDHFSFSVKGNTFYKMCNDVVFYHFYLRDHYNAIY